LPKHRLLKDVAHAMAVLSATSVQSQIRTNRNIATAGGSRENLAVPWRQSMERMPIQRLDWRLDSDGQNVG
jgi:hypothetical protein